MRVLRLFQPGPAAQVGVHHVALDGPGADHGHLDGEVVELGWLMPRQHGHLRPAFDLEGAERVGLLDHGVGGFVVAGNAGDVMAYAAMSCQQVKRAAHAAEHAQAQDIDLHELQDIDIVLVPFDYLAVLHGGGFDGDQVGQFILGEHEAARVLRHVARMADQLLSDI